MRGHLPSRRRSGARALAEVYSGVVVVAVTLALSAFVYSQAHFQVTNQPVYSSRSYAVFGSPSVLHLQINSSAPSLVGELRVDGSSSLQGILRLEGSGYSVGDSLCGAGVTTFFSVNSTAGLVSVSTDGLVWIDGIRGGSLLVQPGFHEVVVDDGSQCKVTLPGGESPSFPSPQLSTVPRVGSGAQSFLFLIPYVGSGHPVTIVFSGGIEGFET